MQTLHLRWRGFQIMLYSIICLIFTFFANVKIIADLTIVLSFFGILIEKSGLGKNQNQINGMNAIEHSPGIHAL